MKNSSKNLLQNLEELEEFLCYFGFGGMEEEF